MYKLELDRFGSFWLVLKGIMCPAEFDLETRHYKVARNGTVTFIDCAECVYR